MAQTKIPTKQLPVVTTVANPGLDTAVPTEKAVRTAIAGVGGGNVSDTGATTANHLAVWNGASDHKIKDGGVVPGGGTGDVVGPGGATSGNLALFDGATGKLIKDGGSPFRANLVLNGYFTTGNANWTATAPATITQAGGQGVVSRVNSGFNDHMVYQDVTVVTGQLYLVGVDFTARGGAGQMYFYVIDNGVTRTLVTAGVPPMTYLFAHLAASTTLRISFSVGNDVTGTLTIDNVFVIPL